MPRLAESFMTKAIIFDLDSCLSAADEPGQQLYAPTCAAIIHTNQGSHSSSVLQNAFGNGVGQRFDVAISGVIENEYFGHNAFGLVLCYLRSNRIASVCCVAASVNLPGSSVRFSSLAVVFMRSE